MRSNLPWLSKYGTGVMLVLVIAVVSVWLGVQGKLGLYINPRYIVFTVVMCGLAILATLAGLAVRAHAFSLISSKARKSNVVLSVVCLALVSTLVFLRPAGLTSSIANQRGVDTSALNASTANVDELTTSNTAYQHFRLKNGRRFWRSPTTLACSRTSKCTLRVL